MRQRVSVAEHLHNLYPYSLHRMIKVSSKSWHAILCLITSWQYSQGLACLSCLGSISRALASYSISYHALAVSTEAWHAFLYLITPWQYQRRLSMLFYILSRLGSICLDNLITTWQHLLRLGMLFYILSCLGSICLGLACLSRLGSTSRGLACLSCLGSIC